MICVSTVQKLLAFAVWCGVNHLNVALNRVIPGLSGRYREEADKQH